MTLSALIDKQDTVEIILEELASILAIETASQQALAFASSRNPDLWSFRVFVGRVRPWESFGASPAPIDPTPIVNVSFDNETFDRAKGNVFERQQASATYNIDCYGYVPADDEVDLRPVDERALREAMRIVRLVRNILMSPDYVSLARTGVVGRRWIDSIAILPQGDTVYAEQVLGVRIALRVDFNELAPQVQGTPLTRVSVGIKRRATGELYFSADYGG